jgi:RNA recognition motif-containing protein
MDPDVVRVARRVYVGNLSWHTSWQDLKDYFAKAGTVRYADVMREAGPGSRSKGCGIVEYETPEEAVAAIQQLNHTELDGRQIFVREDREDYELRGSDHGGSDREHRPPGKRPRHAAPGGAAVTIGRRVFVSNLPYDLTWQELKDHFKAAGHVAHADILGGEGANKGCGIVEFESPADALRAISLLSNSSLRGRQIMVREDREDPAVQRGGGDSRGGGGPAAAPAAEGTQVVIHGIPYSYQWQELKDLCRAAGAVARADVQTNPDGTSKGYGLVAFASSGDASRAIQMLNGTEVEGRIITVKMDKFAH